ncbi:MAG: hypothetical protein KJI72_01835 [Patescibacteria group bacterium]|nr:hypothetical protein [Patescibacteria group bacterium]
MKKNLVIVIVIIIVLALVVIWRWQTGQVLTPAPVVTEEAVLVEELLEEDTTSAAIEVLDSLDLIDLDAEFEAIDAELNQL